MASLIKRKWNSQHVPPCGKGVYIRWQHLIFFYLCAWFSCIKKIGESCICWAVGPALQNNSSNCLVLILHRQLGNLRQAFYKITKKHFTWLKHISLELPQGTMSLEHRKRPDSPTGEGRARTLKIKGPMSGHSICHDNHIRKRKLQRDRTLLQLRQSLKLVPCGQGKVSL